MWEIEYSGTRQSVEAWGVVRPTMILRRLSLAPDVLAFDVAADVDEADVFAPGGTVKLYRGEAKYFEGRVDQTPKTASGRYESHGYVIVGPWWYLDHLAYRMAWQVYADVTDPEAGLVTYRKSRLLVGVNTDGTRRTTQEQIEDVLEFAIAREAPFQVGTISLPSVDRASYEIVARQCSEVLLRELQYTPDATAWFDYSTSPPTLHIGQSSALSEATLAVPTDGRYTGGYEIREADFRPRHDLQVPAVVIEYERTHYENGFAYGETILDIAPVGATGDEFGALVSPVALEGSSINYTLVEVVCSDVLAESAIWWKAQIAKLDSEDVKNLEVVADSVERASDLPRRMLTGQVTTWMLAEGFEILRETIRARVDYDVVSEGDEGVLIEERRGEEVSVEVVTTNLESGTYRNVDSVEFAEAVPVGLAQHLYNATSRLQYDGQIVIVEDECSGRVGIGNALNVSGLKASWASMNAVVQSVTEEIDSGRTSIVVGPAKHLGKDDIIELLQQNRTRVKFTPSQVLSTGKAAHAAPIELGKQTPEKTTGAGNGKVDRLVVGPVVSGSTLGGIIMDKADNPDGRQIKLREMAVKVLDDDGNCSDGYVLALCSAVYTK